MAPCSKELPVPGVLLHAVVTAVDHQEMPILIKGNPSGSVKLTSAASLHTPFTQELPLLVKDGNTLQGLVGNIDILLVVQGNGHWPHHLAVCTTTGADVTAIVLVHSADG